MKHKSSILFSKDKLGNFLLINLLYLLGIVIVYIIKPSYLLNIIIVYIPGLLYTLSLLKNSRRKILLFALLSLLFIIPVEVLARLTDSWDVLSDFPRIFGIVPIENVLYALVNIMYPLVFYEYFYDEDRNRKISRNWKILLLGFLLLFISVLGIMFINKDLLRFDYWIIGVCIYIPIFILLFRYKRHILRRLLVVGLIFGVMFMIHEVISMLLGHWWWPGNYLLPINIAGHIYPLDDFFIWVIFSNVAVVSGYEVMWD